MSFRAFQCTASTRACEAAGVSRDHWSVASTQAPPLVTRQGTAALPALWRRATFTTVICRRDKHNVHAREKIALSITLIASAPSIDATLSDNRHLRHMTVYTSGAL